jgi:hypothetical protein
MALLESLVKSPVMNNRCLICAIVVVLCQGQRTCVIIDSYGLPTSFCSIYGILLGYF